MYPYCKSVENCYLFHDKGAVSWLSSSFDAAPVILESEKLSVFFTVLMC